MSLQLCRIKITSQLITQPPNSSTVSPRANDSHTINRWIIKLPTKPRVSSPNKERVVAEDHSITHPPDSVIMLLHRRKVNCHLLPYTKLRILSELVLQKQMKPTRSESEEMIWKDCLLRISRKRVITIYLDQVGICPINNSGRKVSTTQWLRDLAKMSEHLRKARNYLALDTTSILKSPEWISRHLILKQRVNSHLVRRTIDSMCPQEKYQLQRQTYMNLKLT